MTSAGQASPGDLADADAFGRRIAKGAPLFLPGACRDWPAVAAAERGWDALAAYLSPLTSGAMAEAFSGPPHIAGRYYYDQELEGFNFTREPMTLAALLARIATRGEDPEVPSLYMGSLAAEHHLPGFAERNRLRFLDPGVAPRVWLGTASTVACHFDLYDNIACVVAGHRRFTLYPPDAIGDLYPGPIDHTMAGQPVALAAGSAPGDPRYPRFEQARGRAIVVDCGPGDALFVPKLWWHQVEATAPANMLVNYWWDAFAAGPDSPNIAMMLAMIAIAERPAAERAAWRVFFDHYVFRPNGHPLRHLPVARHGILGPLREGNYGRIRATMMRLLRGG